MIVSFLALKKERRFVYLAHTINAFLVILLYKTNYLISGAHKYFFGFYGKAGPFYIYTIIIFLVFSLRGIYLLFKRIQSKQLDIKKQTQAKYMLTGLFIAHLASVDFLPKFNIEFYPPGAIFILLWVIIIAYSILKHQLLDISIVLKKGVIYSLLVSCISIIYLLSVIIFEKSFQNFLGYKTVFGSMTSAVLIAIISIPLRNKIQYFVDKFFFKGTPVEIAEQNQLLRKELAHAEKMKAVATLASGLAHEIKNPITAIKTFTDHLQQKKNDPVFLENFSRIVGTEVNRIDSLVHQLLDFAKPAPLKLEPTNIHQLLDDTVDLLHNKLLQHKIQLIKNYNASSTILNIDANQLKQALLNILMNAIDAMPDGGTLTITTSLDLPPKPLPLNPKNFTIIIEDTGCGISLKDLPNIFEPFFSKKTNGTGLGLSITQGIIKEHKGSIKVMNSPIKGVIFIIELPLI